MFPRILLPGYKACHGDNDKSANSTPKPSMVISLIGAGGKTSTLFWLANQYRQRQLSVLVTTTTKMYLPSSQQADYIISLSTSQNIPLPRRSSQIEYLTGQHQLHIARSGISFAYQSLIPEQCNTNNSLAQDVTPLKVQGVAPQDIDALAAMGLFDVILVEADGAKHRWVKCPDSHEPALPRHSDIVIAVTGAEALGKPVSDRHIHRLARFSRITGCKAGERLTLMHLARLIRHPDGMFKQVPTGCRCIWLLNKACQCNLWQGEGCSDKALAPARLRQLLNSHRQLDAIWLADMDIPALYQVITP
ncbi:selenium-dependent hydroxylase accessory protein [Shewanella sp. NFH-SH190041]|uniref:selenium cofactor biosynthesis protein YqeC n=1 Tax=Shewanella sp. NFH-SH190041 TaxID=2950245 RepID=UPI0021C338BA|nr:selenium cofactor biosynthesis protein YqeC [Shewanella sp. NFH-SH190041]BDM64850.1 selenium-dependent hydroxylase accessory protein [Shewanella sp. NFH-SH190041]